MKKLSKPVGVAVALTSLVALAAASPLLISIAIQDGMLSIGTNAMPKGWFSSRNTLDRTKTNLVTNYSLGATSCSDAKAGGTINSSTQGTFTPQLNSQGQTTAYFWDSTVDLSSQANHWYYHHHCDGTTEVHGCADAITVSVTTTAYASSGECRTYVNDAGQTVCASDSQQALLASVQDPDVTDVCATPEAPDCGIGPCVSTCEQACQSISGRDARQACQKACPCDCKAKLPAACQPHPECD